MDELVINKYVKLCSKKVFCEKNFKNPFTLHFKIESPEAFLKYVENNLIKLKKFKFRETHNHRLVVKGLFSNLFLDLESWTKTCLGELFEKTFYSPDLFAAPFQPLHTVSNADVKRRLSLDEPKEIFIAKFSKENNVDEFLYYLQAFLEEHTGSIIRDFELRQDEISKAIANGFKIN
ncbi:hypothetical protein MOD62_16365 [Bacillus spizizenii]|nr:hypothetical protein [Bacillus spizizenii]MCY8635312.1 hypothetical protein [Bacillus spizizenii]